MYNILLLIIKFFHLFIILFELIIPFTKIPYLLIIHILFSICLMFHWYCNSDMCCLTVLEAYIKNVNINKTVLYQFIAPLYNISELYYSKLIWILTIILLLISCYNLAKTNKINLFYYKIKHLKNYNINNILDCIKYLI